MPKPETAAKRFATHIIRSGEIYKGATRDAKALCEETGVDWDELSDKVGKSVDADDGNDDDDGDATGSKEMES